ncbi:hypothetical protein [Paraburkholderia sp. SIMBA_054]|uniref:hypothetical protein n=1 Tax=Paraburkholderia sp. SIMBA_054 TaxID=3085795 RepID=UPI003979E747
MANFRGTRQVGRVEDLSEAHAAAIEGVLTVSCKHQMDAALMHEARAIRLVPYDVSRAPRAEAVATRGNTRTPKRMLEIGDWRLAIGDWRLAIGDWRLTIGD